MSRYSVLLKLVGAMPFQLVSTAMIIGIIVFFHRQRSNRTTTTMRIIIRRHRHHHRRHRRRLLSWESLRATLILP